jgi:hypothetical protein
MNKVYQQNYRLRQLENNPDEYRQKQREYMKLYRANKNSKRSLLPQKTELTTTSKKDYIYKLNLINKLMLGFGVEYETASHVTALLNGGKYKQSIIKTSLHYLRNIDDVIKKLREQYPNDNSYRAFINVLTVITKKLNGYKRQYDKLSKINIDLSLKYSAERDKNELKEEDTGKIIPLDDDEINKNINTLTDLTDKILYIFSVKFMRRLEIKDLILSYEDRDDENILLVNADGYPDKLIFNHYKTFKKYGKQIVDIPDDIKAIIKDYLDKKEITIGDYIFPQKTNKKKFMEASNFSFRIKEVFKKLYGTDVTNRFVRMSYASSKKDTADAYKEFLKDAEKLSHSAGVHLQYIKN